MAETAARENARLFVEITVVHCLGMARPIEDCLLEMTGRTSRLRLNRPRADAGAPRHAYIPPAPSD